MAKLPSVDNVISILQLCRKKKNLLYAKHVHAWIRKCGLESHRAVGNHIVPMFVECGSVFDAQGVFNRLVYRNVHSWTSLMLGYIESGQSRHALNLYEEMLEDCVYPSSYTLMALLKACTRLNDVERGRAVHVEIIQMGLEEEVFIGNTLVDMYAKCGSLAEAQSVFVKLPVQNVVSWTALIAGYAEHGPGQEALQCFEQMQLQRVRPNSVTFVCILKACGNMGAMDKGREIHTDIVQMGFESDVYVGSTLVDMYAKCGSLAEAQEVFDQLPLQNVVSCTALIAGYAEHGPGQEALKLFQQMQVEGISPNSVTHICILKACGCIGAINKGREIHVDIALKALERDVFVGSALVDMYSKCGSLVEAREVFGKMPVRNVVSWNALIAGYAEHGPGHEALRCFEQMQLRGVTPDVFTFACIVKACGKIGAIDKGREIHTQITQKGFERDVFVGSTLVDMYARCGSLAEAREIFESLPVRDVVSWNALIAGHADHGPSHEALKCFEQMQLEGVSPDAVTFVCILKACGTLGAIDKGREVHYDIAQKGLDRDAFVGNTLVDMYAKCGSLAEAQEVFDKLAVRNVVSWTAMIAGYAEHGPAQEALDCFEQMQLQGVLPNAVTFVCSLKACASTGSIGKGRDLHADIAQIGFERDVFVGSTLIDMYVKCGSLADAQKVFDKMPVRNAVSYNALIAGYAEHGPCQEALKYFEQMQVEGVPTDAVTYICSLKACGSIGAIDKGREIHADVIQKGFERDSSVGSTLIDMYARCGSLSEAREVFEKLPVRDIVSWNAMIKGYGLNQAGNMAVQLFDDMQEHGVRPDDVTFTCLLTACSRAKLVRKGQEFFNIMREEYGIAPTIDHYTCMVDLLAKSGHLFDAEKFLETMPSSPVWTALLTGCKVFGEAELGLRCFQQLVQIRPEAAVSYMLMARTYASAGKLDDAYRIEELRIHAGAKKKPAVALIEVNKEVHEFLVGNNQSLEVSTMLELLISRMREEGHVPNVNLVLRPVFDEKEAALCGHAE